jgi:Uncharacterized protein conserved in bacteria (DUF2062)
VRARVIGLRATIAEIPPERAALLLCVGLVLGVFPIAGVPTLLCLFAAFVLRLNAPALQLLNRLSSPLQIVLLLPLARIGSRLCGAAIGSEGSWSTKIAAAGVHAVAGWASTCVPAGVLLYVILLATMRRAMFKAHS